MGPVRITIFAKKSRREWHDLPRSAQGRHGEMKAKALLSPLGGDLVTWAVLVLVSVFVAVVVEMDGVMRVSVLVVHFGGGWMVTVVVVPSTSQNRRNGMGD